MHMLIHLFMRFQASDDQRSNIILDTRDLGQNLIDRFNLPGEGPQPEGSTVCG